MDKRVRIRDGYDTIARVFSDEEGGGKSKKRHKR